MKKIYLIATITALIAGLATYFFATQLAENSTLEDIQKYSVVVAVEDIPAEAVISPEMIEVKQLPYLAVTPGAVTNADSIIGKMTLYPMVAGEQVLSSKVVAVGVDNADPGRLSYQLKSGQYAYTLDVNLVSSASEYLRDGDYVNIYYEGDVNEYGEPAKVGTADVSLLYENVKVIKLSTLSANLSAEAAGGEVITYSSVMLLLDRDQLESIMRAQQMGGKFTLILVSYSDAADIADQVSEVTVEVETVPVRYQAETTTAAQ